MGSLVSFHSTSTAIAASSVRGESIGASALPRGTAPPAVSVRDAAITIVVHPILRKVHAVNGSRSSTRKSGVETAVKNSLVLQLALEEARLRGLLICEAEASNFIGAE